MALKISRILLVFLIISSCKDEKETKGPPLHFENKSIIKESEEDCENASFLCSFIRIGTIEAAGPKEISEKINTRLQQHIIDLVSTEEDQQISSLGELADTFLRNQQKTAAEFEEDIPWKADINTSIYSHTEKLLSIGVEAQIFTGGAHGYRSLTFLNFDPKTGELYQQKDLFTKEFKEYAEVVFRKKQEIPKEENINSTGFWFENDEFHLPENIGVDNQNILLVYNAYEIASYANGDITLEIPIEEAQSFINFK